MPKIALISCTSSKKSYTCKASELYSESPRFRLAYQFAEIVADKIFILSAKYGLVPEDRVIEPYNESLKNKNTEQRREWSVNVLSELNRVTDLEQDDYIVLAGEIYIENLLPHFKNYRRPLKGKALGEWIPELKRLINLEKKTDNANVLHILFNGLPRLDWTMINQLPYRNGIYIMFEKGEGFLGQDRIVRLGTHRGQNRLCKRLGDHFIKEDADGSIFRKNIGRAYLNIAKDPYLRIWEIDRRLSENARNNGHLLDQGIEAELEAKISAYLRNNISFVCFPVEEKEERLRLEEGIIATLNRFPAFGPGEKWLGLCSPVPDIAQSGLWNRHGLKGQPLTDMELERVKYLTGFGNGSGNDTIRMQEAAVMRDTNKRMMTAHDEDAIRGQTADDIRKYIDELFQRAREQNKEYVDLLSGEIHRQLGMKNRMPGVCTIMFEKKMTGDEVLHTTPSGKSSTIKIRYYVNRR